MTPNDETFLNHVVIAANSGYWREVIDFAGSKTSYGFKEPSPDAGILTPEVVRAIADLRNNPNFLYSADSHMLIHLIESDWWMLDDDAKQTLLDALEEMFNKTTNELSFFLISEILGEYFSNSDAFDLLLRLDVPDTLGRPFIPHGLYLFTRLHAKEPLGRMALANLLRLSKDNASDVRQEAMDRLRVLIHKGILSPDFAFA